MVLDFNPMQLLRNDGAGTFEDVTSSLPSIRVNGVAAADFDLDGLTDIVTLNRAGGTISAVALSFIVHDPSGIMLVVSERSLASRRLR